MFIRQRRSGQRIYAEALVSFRDPDTGKSRHRCVARWPAAHSLAEEIDEMQRDHDRAQRNVTFWQGLIDRTVEPRYPAQIRRAPANLQYWLRSVATTATSLARLGEARAGLEQEMAEKQARGGFGPPWPASAAIAGSRG